MTKFTVWEILLDHFQVTYEQVCPHYLAKKHPPDVFVEGLAKEFVGCPRVSHEEFRAMIEHFHNHSDLVERIYYSETFSEEVAIELLESFALTPEFKTREVDFSKIPNTDQGTGQNFEVWRQDDNGNEFPVERFPCEYEAQLLRKRLERRGHKQHYWVKRVR